MSCEISSKQYFPIVKDLYKLNKDYYKNYDNVVKFLVSSNLPDEQKKLAIHHMADIYMNMYMVEPNFCDIGKAKTVLDSSSMLSNTPEYLKLISSYYGFGKNTQVTSENILLKLEELKAEKFITSIELTNKDGILPMIQSYYATSKFPTEEDKANFMKQIKGQLIEIIDGMSELKKDNKDILKNNVIETFFTTFLTPVSKYIPLSSVQEQIGLDNYLLYLKNNTMVEATLIDGQFFKVTSDNLLEKINPEDIQFKKAARPGDMSESNGGEHIFTEDFFLSGLTIDSATQAEYNDVIKELNELSSPSSAIRIYAVKLGGTADQRVKRIQDLAMEDPEKYGTLGNRQHETFESQSQIRKLRAEPNAKVLTVSRPKSSEQAFALVGKLNSGKTFFLYSMDNYVVVSADNTTERFDLTKTAHVNLLKELSKKKTFKGLQNLSNDDVKSLLNTQIQFDLFTQSILNRLSEEFKTRDSSEVTDEFKKFFDFTTDRPKTRTQTPLRNLIESDIRYSQQLTIVTKDGEGNIISENIRRIPFTFSKIIDVKTKSISYKQDTYLASNEFIKYEYQGEVYDDITEDTYFNTVLNGKPILDLLFTEEDKKINEELKNDKPNLNRVNKTNRFVLTFDNNKIKTAHPAVTKFQLESEDFFAKYITAFASVLNEKIPAKKEEALKTLIKESYKIKDFKNILSFQFHSDNLGNLNLEVRPYKNNDPRFASVFNEEDKKFFNFRIDSNLIQNMSQVLLDDTSKVIKDVISEYPVLSNKAFDLKSKDGIYAFYATVMDLSYKNPESKSLNALVKTIQNVRDSFSKLIETSVIDKLKGSNIEAHKEFINIIKDDITFRDGKMHLEALLFETVDDKKILKINSPQSRKIEGTSSAETQRYQFNNAAKNLAVLDNVYKKNTFRIISRNNPNRSATDIINTVATNPIEEEKKTETKQDTPLSENTKNVIPEVATKKVDRRGTKGGKAFKLISSSDRYRVAEPFDIVTESQWLSQALPMFNLDTENLKNLVDLVNIDGAVLGMFKDRVIYLNNALPAKGVIYHEAFHGVFRYLLDNTERKNLVNQIVTDRRHSDKFTRDNVYSFAKQRNFSTEKYSYDDLVSLIAEEILADGFQNYMQKKSKPKGILQKFYEFLKNLLNLFVKKQNEIENLYGKIKTGYYKTATIKSDMFDGQVAYEILNGPAKYRYDDSGEVEIVDSYLDSQDQENLINMVVGQMLQDTSNTNFNSKFEQATIKLLEIYDVNNLTSTQPFNYMNFNDLPTKGEVGRIYRTSDDGKVYGWNGINYNLLANSNEERITNIKKFYGELYSQYRFVLGGRFKGYEVFDINTTRDSQYDLDQNQSTVYTIDDQEFDNTNGEYSYTRLAALVKEEYSRAAYFNKFEQNKQESTIDSDEIESVVLQDDNTNIGGDLEKRELKDELGSNFEEGYGEEDRTVDSYVKQVRRFLTSIRNDKYDEKLGVFIPQMVNGNYMFPALLQHVANYKPRDIVDAIRVFGETQIEDGFYNFGKDLLAVYNQLVTVTNANIEGKFSPKNNKYLVNTIVDALHGVQLDYRFFKLAVPEALDIDDVSEEYEVDTVRKEVRVKINDKVVETDVRIKRDSLITKFLTEHSSSANNIEYKNAIKELIEFGTNYINSNNVIISQAGVLNKDILVEMTTDKIHKAMKTIGLNVPRSLVKLSLLAINDVEKKVPQKYNEKITNFYELNQDFVRNNQYLESAFFSSLATILQQAYTKYNKAENKNVSVNPDFEGAIPNRNFKDVIDDAKTSDISVTTVMSVLKNASHYIIKNDASTLPSVIRNAEGKSIYRFAKFNPLYQVGLKTKTGDVNEIFKDDPFWNINLKDFINDNSYLGELMNNPDSQKSKMTRFFLRNFKVATFGGVQQQVGDFFKEGQTFKTLDRRSLYLLQIYSFMDQTYTFDPKTNSKVVTYFKSYHQLESTNTNFLISGLYQPFLSNNYGDTVENGKYVVNEETGHLQFEYRGKKYDKIVETLLDVVKQEYNRINREWVNRVDRKINYDNKNANTIVPDYNGTLNNDGKTSNVDSSSLRAYNFHKLSDFFNKEENEDLNDSLIALAKGLDPAGFVEFDKIDNTALLDALQEYAQEEFDNYIQKLIDVDLLVKSNIDENDMADTDPENPNRVTTYVTQKHNFLPKIIKTNGINKVNINAIYPEPKGFKNPKLNPGYVKLMAVEPVEPLLYDQFMNNWYNGLIFNDLMDGDIALNVKNSQDYIKRLKKIVATGSNMKEGVFKSATIASIQQFIHDDFPTYGPYASIAEIDADFSIKSETLKNELKTGFRKAAAKQVEEVRDENGKLLRIQNWKKMMREVTDGQAWSTLLHQIDMHNSLGRIDEKALEILIDKNFRSLNKDEVNYLENLKIVNNAKKTVTASRNIYLKCSEDYIDRNDVSILNIRPEPNESREDAVLRIYDELRELYLQVYEARQSIHEININMTSENPDNRMSVDESTNAINSFESQIKNLFTVIHSYFRPVPHRKMLHDMLNSMEYHNIDQLNDPSVSKNASLLPIDVYTDDNKDSNGYFNFEFSSLKVPRESKFLQIETSGVSELAKNSVQGKVLLPADIDEKEFEIIMNEEAKLKNKVITESELTALKSLKSTLDDYKLTLKKATQARFNYFKEVLRKGNDFEIGKLYTMIRESLQSQNAPTPVLDMFGVKPDGTPVINPNVSITRDIVEYYLLAQYSKYVTDEKVSGGKSFHSSSWGYNVLVNKISNEVILTESYLQNPEMFSDTNVFGSRPLSITKEIQPDGTTLYLAEVIVPKPYFENPEHERFWMENLTKGLGTRIPTEDKRSMIAFKIVDFVDSSKLNNIIVPQFIHLLAGSDFDIDALYYKTMAYYKNGKRDYVAFGDYSKYSDPQTGKFIEYLHYMSRNDDFAPLIKERKKQLIDQEEVINLYPKSALYDIIRGLKYKISDIDGVYEQKILESEYDSADRAHNFYYQAKEDVKELFVAALEEHEETGSPEALSRRLLYGKLVSDTRKKMEKELSERREVEEKIKILDAAYQYQAILDVLSEYKLPASIENFNSRKGFSDIVAPVHQNENLKASIDLLGNEAVFNYLYINQRSSLQQFNDILKAFGLNVEDVKNKRANLYTTTAVVETKAEVSGGKDGIGITAIMNKFLALANQLDFELKDEAVIWKYKDLKGKEVVRKSFGKLNDNNQRTIGIMGNILGGFTDIVKDPVMLALKFNEINTSTTIAMIGIGLDPEFAIAFNFLPEIRKAAEAVNASKFAISDNVDDQYLFFNKAINNQIADIINSKNDDGSIKGTAILSNLKSLGIVDAKTPEIRFKTDWSGNIILNTSNLKMGIVPQSFDKLKLSRNILTPSDIGFQLYDAKTNLPLSDDEARVVLLAMYQQQAEQTWDLSKTASVTNFFKRLNPTVEAFDKLAKNLSDFKTGKLFTKGSVERFFDDKEVWTVFEDLVDDAMTQFSKIFLERTPFFEPFTKSLETYFSDKKTLATVMTSFMALHKFKNTYPTSRKEGIEDEYLLSQIDKDNKNIEKIFSPEYWFTDISSLYYQIESMLKKYPNNDFLKLLKLDNTGAKADVNFNGQLYQDMSASYIRMLNKAKVKGSYANKVADDLKNIYENGTTEEKLFVRELFYHELVRTGFGNARGSFMAFMPVEFKLPLSNYIGEFITGLQSLSQYTDPKEYEEKFKSFLLEYLGKDNINDVYKHFDDLHDQLVYAATKDKSNYKIKSFRDSKNTNAISLYINAKTLGGSKRIITAFTPKEAVLSDYVTAKTKAAQHIINALDLKEAYSKKDISELSEISLSNLGDTFSISLNSTTKMEKKADEVLGKMFSIKISDKKVKDRVLYDFPSIIKIDNKIYSLQGVDTSSKRTAGQNLVESAIGKVAITNTGNKATYIRMPDDYSSDGISSIGFTKEDSKKYIDYTKNKKVIQYNTKTKITNEQFEESKKSDLDKMIEKNPLLKDLMKKLDLQEKEEVPNEIITTFTEPEVTETATTEVDDMEDGVLDTDDFINNLLNAQKNSQGNIDINDELEDENNCNS